MPTELRQQYNQLLEDIKILKDLSGNNSKTECQNKYYKLRNLQDLLQQSKAIQKDLEANYNTIWKRIRQSDTSVDWIAVITELFDISDLVAEDIIHDIECYFLFCVK